MLAEPVVAPATHDSTFMSARCALALNLEQSDWLLRLTTACIQKHTHEWRTLHTDRLAETILMQVDFLQAMEAAALTGKRLQARRYFIHHPQMGLPLGVEGELALPDLPTAGDIADWLALSPGELDWFADLHGLNRKTSTTALRHYACKWIEKRNGAPRLIEAPKQRLARMQRRILHTLLDYVPPHETAHGFRARHSILTHARAHSGKGVVVRIDLQDFFTSIHAARVHALFTALGYPRDAARVLTGLCTHRTPSDVLQAAPPAVLWSTRRRLAAPHLPQGAPTSPALANLCAFGLDVRLESLAQTFDMAYTRYADDLTFSGPASCARQAQRLERLVASIALEEGFTVNHRKTRVMTQAMQQRVTGAVVNQRPGVDRRTFDRLKAVLYNCVRYGPGSQNHAAQQDWRAHLCGKVAHVAMLNPVQGKKLQALFQKIDWSI